MPPMSASSTVAIDDVNRQSSYPRKPALGPSFTHLTDATVWLSAVMQDGSDNDEGRGDRPTHVVQVLRSRKKVSYGFEC
jgi:hypothetical protein